MAAARSSFILMSSAGSLSMIINDPATAVPEHWRAGVETRMIVSAANGASTLCIFEQWVAPGAGAPTHSHQVEEVLTVRAGEAEIWLAGERMTLAAGQSVIVPARTNHGFRNSGSATLHLHAVLAAPVFEALAEGATEVTRRWQGGSSA
jgi:mannose-6-phosphate isomerase-like protein (cupin superfamily)